MFAIIQCGILNHLIDYMQCDIVLYAVWYCFTTYYCLDALLVTWIQSCFSSSFFFELLVLSAQNFAIKECRCYEVKIGEGWAVTGESNPGHLWIEPPVLCHWAMTAGQPPTLCSRLLGNYTRDSPPLHLPKNERCTLYVHINQHNYFAMTSLEFHSYHGST